MVRQTRFFLREQLISRISLARELEIANLLDLSCNTFWTNVVALLGTIALLGPGRPPGSWTVL